MIFESGPWKTELERWSLELSNYAANVDCSQSGVPFEPERALFYSAFIIRKLIENRKVSDSLSETLIEVSVHDASLEEIKSRLQFTSADFDVGRDYSDIASHRVQMQIKDLVSEIIHSFFLMWSAYDNIHLDGFFLSSYKLHTQRAVWLKLEKYIEIIDKVVSDKIMAAEIFFDSEAGEKILKKY